MEQKEEILQRMKRMLKPLGFEIYPFKVGWYNEHVEKEYKLSLSRPDDTLGVLVLSIPDMWEKAFIPFAREQDWDNWDKEKHPLRECMIYNFDRVKKSFPEHDVEVMHQFEMVNGRAKILVQPAAHVAGAAYYYQKLDVTRPPWPEDKDVLCPDLPQRDPKDLIDSQEKRVELLEKFNFPQWLFRDILPVPRKYAEEHKEYLSSDLDEKIDIAKQIKSEGTS